MQIEKQGILYEQVKLQSVFLTREVTVDLYSPPQSTFPNDWDLLLFNDGQDLPIMEFQNILNVLYERNAISPILCVGIHCGPERKLEYGTAISPDYKGRGAKAPAYKNFIILELIPFIQQRCTNQKFLKKGFAGFSLGGLTALDIVWNSPAIFSIAGVFSGSFWWRSKDQDDAEYKDDTDRIMHQQIRAGEHKPGLQFFFQCGTGDEIKDRNNNGVIDSIDDTLDLIRELNKKGYTVEDIFFLLLEGGKHDPATWSRALPTFLEWAYGPSTKNKPGH